MADKQMGITVTGDISDVSEQLNNLIELINSIPDRVIEITANMADVVSDVTTLADDLNAIPQDAENVSAALDNIDASKIADAASAAGDLSQNLQDATGDADDASTATDSVADSTGNVSTGAGIAGLGIAGMVAGMVGGAGNIRDQWARTGILMGGTATQAAATWGGAITGMTQATGRGASDARDFLNNMGIAGVTNASTIAQGFTDISGAAFLTGNSLQGVESAYQRVIMSGTLGSRQLMQLGINSSDVYKATGLTVAQLSAKMKNMSQEQRAEMLNNIMNVKDGTVANTAYKNSWQHSLDAATRAGQYIGRELGALVLPTAKWAVDLLTKALNGLAVWLDKLHGPTGNLIKDILAAVLIFVSFIGVLVAVVAAMKLLQIWSAIVAVWNGILRISQVAAAAASGDFGKALRILRGIKETDVVATEGQVVAENEGIFARVKSGISTVALTAYNYALAAAKWVVTAAQYAWNVAITAGILASNGMLIAVIRQTAANWLNSESRTAQIAGLVLYGAAAFASVAATTAATIATGALSAATALLDIVMDANPIMLVVLALIAIAAVLIYAYEKVDWFRNGINFVWDTIKKFAGYLLMTNPFTLWIGALILLYQHFGQIRNIIVNVWQTITNSLNKLWFFFNVIWSEIYVFVMNQILKIKAIPGDIWKWFTDALNKIWFDLNVIWSEIYVFVMNTVRNIKAIPGDLFDWVMISIAKAWLSVEWWWNHIIGFVDMKVAYIKGLPQELWDWIYGGIKSAFDKVYKFFQDLANYLINLPQNMQKWGKDIILGLINGIVNAIPGLRQALSAIGINFPQSPPKEGPLADVTAEGFHNWGSSLIDGLAKGVSKSKDVIKGALTGISGSMDPTKLSLGNAGLNAVNNPSGSNQYNINVALTLPDGTSAAKAKALGQSTADGIGSSSILNGLIRSGGKPNVLIRKVG